MEPVDKRVGSAVTPPKFDARVHGTLDDSDRASILLGDKQGLPLFVTW